MSRRTEILERWRRVTREVDPETAAHAQWANEPVPHFLHAFRPDGARLPELFAGLPGMSPVLDRLRVIFERAGAGDHLYFVVSRARPMDAPAVERTVQAWLNRVGSLVEELQLDVDDDVKRFLASDAISIQLIEGRPPSRNPRDHHPVVSAIYEAVTEFGLTMTFDDEARDLRDLLREPLYMLACSYALAYWVLSPLAPETRDDPLAPAAALWEAGVELDFEGEGRDIRAVAYRLASGA